ncbi:MAG: flagellar hook-associated protein FlgK [Mariprofundus sp.]
MIFDSLTIAGSSLKAHQKAMDVVSHNIANVNTPGYSRQTSTLVTEVPEKIGLLNLGRGVDVQSIQRNVAPLIDTGLRNNSAQSEFYSTLSSGLAAVENVFGSLESTGLAAGLDDFFLAWQSLANNPQDQGQQFNVRSKSESLTFTLSNMHQQLSDAQVNANAEIDQHIHQANLLLSEIASLSMQIQRQENASTGKAGMANDLHDKRDQAVRDLSALIPVQQVATNDGGLLLQTVGGDLLVQDGVARTLARSSSAGSTGFSEIVVAGTSTPVAGLDQGGKIGGLIELRDNKFGDYMASVDSIAANLIFAVNQVHASGVGSGRVSSLTSGQGILNPALAIDDVAHRNAFTGQIQSGSFSLHVYDNVGNPLTPGGTLINITAGVTTMNDVAAAISAVAGVTASVDTAGRLVVDAGSNTLGFSDDSSNFLAAYEINALFHGQGAGSITLSDAVKADASLISTGQVDAVSSVILPGDNTSALAIMAIQNTPLSIDGSVPSSLHDRTSVLSSRYGTDVAVADQQRVYRDAEAESLQQQRQAISGVNIDEELVEMIKFQRAYEASAKVIQTTNAMLDSLLGLIR